MTAQWGSVTVPDKAWEDIKAACDSTTSLVGRIPYALAVAVAYNENPSFDPKLQSNVPNTKAGQSYNGREDSWGYFQLATFGVGHGYSREQLQDGRTNALIALKEMVLRYTTALINMSDPYAGHGDALREAINPWSVADTAYAAYLTVPTVTVDGTVKDTPGTAILPGAPNVDVTDPKSIGDWLGLTNIIHSLGIGFLKLAVGLSGLAFLVFGLYVLGNRTAKQIVKAVA